MIDNLFQNVWQWTNSFPDSLQFLAVLLAGAIPFLEGHGAAAIGIAVGVLVSISAKVGNVAAMLIVALMSDRVRTMLAGDAKRSGKRQKILQTYDKYGVPITALVAEMWFPPALTTVILISVGASQRQVILWQTISIIVWTVGAALVLTGVLSIFA